MCGIVGTIGSKYSYTDYIAHVLKKMQHRGYDSYGIALLNGPTSNKRCYIYRSLDKNITCVPHNGIMAVGHTRWATSSPVTLEGCHPHESPSGRYLVVHNGTIDGVEDLYCDSKYIVNEVDKWREPLVGLTEVINSKDNIGAFLLVDKKEKVMYAYRDTLPLYINKHGNKVVSDLAAFDEDKAFLLEADKIHRLPVYTFDRVARVKHDHNDAGMYEEIKQQSTTLLHTYQSTLKPSPTTFFGCGTSYHVAMMADKLFNMCGIESNSVYATEIEDRLNNHRYVGFTQSGETKDVLEALDKLNRENKEVELVTNVESSTAAFMCNKVHLLGVGREYGVASTKTMTAMIKLIYDSLGKICPKIRLTPSIEKQALKAANVIKDYDHVLCLGSGLNYPVALETALKIKEVSYIHSEGGVASEIKHGPIALIDENVVSIFIGQQTDSMKHNMSEVKSRGGKVISISKESCSVPHMSLTCNDDVFNYLVMAQYIAYFLAILKGYDPDKPRNLAKTVTV